MTSSSVGCGELANRIIPTPILTFPLMGKGLSPLLFQGGKLGGGWIDSRERCGSFGTTSYDAAN